MHIYIYWKIHSIWIIYAMKYLYIWTWKQKYYQEIEYSRLKIIIIFFYQQKNYNTF